MITYAYTNNFSTYYTNISYLQEFFANRKERDELLSAWVINDNDVAPCHFSQVSNNVVQFTKLERLSLVITK